jgi:hypothetical protein
MLATHRVIGPYRRSSDRGNPATGRARSPYRDLVPNRAGTGG